MKNLTLTSALLLINVLFTAFVANAQGSIDGYVKDANTNEVKDMTLVQLIGDELYGTYTNDDGYYNFGNVKEGIYDMKISFADTFAIWKNVNIVNGKSASLDLAANFDRELGEVEVRAFKGMFNIEKPNVPVIDPERIFNEKPRNPADIVKRIPAAVETTEGISFKGARPGTAVYYIDGIRTYGELYVPMSAVGSIEVYTGGIPAQYGNTTSAVIVVETLSYFDKR